MADSNESFQVSEKRPSQSSGGAAGAGAASSVLYAAQPDVVLSQERDAYYADTLLGESTSELVEALVGPRRAMILAPEMKVLASCLYFGLTNFAGKQTLGQEYCDVNLARGNNGAPPCNSSLRVYTLLRVAVPYLQERLREGWHGLSCLGDPLGGGGAAAALAAARARARARASLAPPVGIAPSSELGETRGVGVEHEAAAALAVAEGTDAPGQGGGEAAATSSATSSPVSNRPCVPSRRRSSSSSVLEAFLRRLLTWARRKRPAISGVFEWLLRLHLAAFYLDGRYVTLAMRAVGARLVYTRQQQDEPRARYAILGVFLLMQAAAEASSVGAEVSTRWRAAANARAAAQGPGQAEAVRGTRDGESQGDGADGAEDGGPASTRVPPVAPERTLADAALFPRSQRRCALCMSPRENTAATPCGHLFCWECIVGWCQTNPECPLCRQPATPQSIVCLYQYA